jgi:hypothetical protein
MSIENMTPEQWKRYTTDKPRRKAPENAVKKAVTNWLTLHGIPWDRQQAGALKVKAPTGREYYVHLAHEGASDIVACLPPYGRFVAIETKQAKGKQRGAQARYQHNIEKAGGIYVLAKNIDDLAPLKTLQEPHERILHERMKPKK